MRDGLFLLVLQMFRRKNVLVFFRGWNPGYFAQIMSSAVRRHLFFSLYGSARRLLVLSSTFAGDLTSIGIDPAKVHVLTTMFDGKLLQTVMRHREDAAVWILFLARFEASKGMYELLEAFRSVSERNVSVRLILAGNGVEAAPARAWCHQNGLQDRVRFPGYVSGAEKAQLLADSDIFVLPSFHHEGCPNAVLEAMGAGLPLVVTPVGGIPDIVQDGVHGLVIRPHDPVGLVAALQRLIADPKLRAEMGRRNRDKAWQDYEAQPVTAKLARHYFELGEQ
jgi:glycosyltransferase involved in cell wall biosynthesis